MLDKIGKIISIFIITSLLTISWNNCYGQATNDEGEYKSHKKARNRNGGEKGNIDFSVVPKRQCN